MRGNSIRPHLMLTLSALLLLTMLMAGFSLFTLWKNQFLLDEVTESTLADTQIASTFLKVSPKSLRWRPTRRLLPGLFKCKMKRFS